MPTCMHSKQAVLSRQGAVLRAPQRNVKANSFGDKMRDFWEKAQFENWAPKSSRAWRLRQYPSEVVSKRDEVEEADFADSLERRMRQISADSQSLRDRQAGAAAPSSTSSFEDADDADLAAALNARLGSTDAGTSALSSADGLADVAVDAPLSAQELIMLVEAKYKYKYDMTIARRSFAGRDFVSLNFMWTHLGQRSFPMNEEDFLDKLDGICILLNAWNKQAEVRKFLRDKPRAKNGMPPRPIVGCAVAFQLDLPPEVVQEWIGDRLG